MESIRSGTTTERIIRTSILTAVLLGYAAWSFVDAYHVYPRRNVEGLVQNLNPSPDPDTVAINPKVTRAAAESIQPGDAMSEVKARLGEPNAVQGRGSFYFGPGGMARIASDGDKVARSGTTWRDGDHNDVDLLLQKIIGSVVGVLGLLMLLQFIRVVTTRIELSEAGLKVNSQGGTRFGGSPLVPFEVMTALDSRDFRKKGWVEIEYKLADGTAGTVSLNDYVHKAFRGVVDEICRRCGFDNPLQAEDKSEPVATGEAEVESPAEPGSPEPRQEGSDQAGQAGG